MSVLPAGRSLRQFFPDLDEFLLDPAAYLTAGPVEMGPRRAYGFAAVFAVLGALCLVACAVSGVWRDERLLIGIGLLIGASVWLGWSLRLRGHSILLKTDGVEFRYRETVVWCPWALFNVEGHPIVPEGDNANIAVVLPVSPEAIPYVELRRNEAAVAYGKQVKAPQFRFALADQVVLSARYEMASRDLGDLLLQLGNRLGRRLPRGAPPPEAYPSREPAHAEFAGPDSGGWYTVSLGRLRFPPRCSNCGQPTDASVPVSFEGGDIAGRLTSSSRAPELSVPLCADCQNEIRHAYQRGGIRGVNIGVVAGMLALAGLAALQGERAPVTLAIAGLGGAAVGGLVGFLAGSAITRPLPVRFRRYRSDSGMLQVHFQDPHYADLVQAASSRKPGTG
jgi:hypothetical protein